jgi:MinD-like ATPase involved in chromosome partitioning or flagellar assembly
VPGEEGASDPAYDDRTAPGHVVAVWGPTGAPGRTSVALGLATEIAAAGTATVLVDADVYGGTIAQRLGLLDEVPGLAAAVRLAGNGSLDLLALARLAPTVAPRLRVLTGISRADRWPELRPSGLEVVWQLTRKLAGVTVVDCGFAVETDEELAYDTSAPRRNGATLSALEGADAVLAVGSADPVGVQRLVRGLAELREACPQVRPQVVLNRVRRGPVGPAPERQLTEALDRYAGVRPVAFVPHDQDAFDASLLHARSLREVAGGSAASGALRTLAGRLHADLTGVAVPRRRRWRRIRGIAG